MNRPCRQYLVSDPGLLDFLHKFDCLIRRHRPVVITGVVFDNGFRLTGFLVRPVILAVQRFHVELRSNSRRFHRDRHLQRMARNTGRNTLLPDVVDKFIDQVHAIVERPAVSLVADQIDRSSSRIHSLVDRFFDSIGLCTRLRQPLHLTPAFLFIATEEFDRFRIARRNRTGINPVFLTERPGIHNLFIGKIMLQQRRHINQIAAVSITADQIASADKSADFKIADFAHRHLPSRFLIRTIVFRLGKKCLFLKAECYRSRRRSSNGFLHKIAAINISGHIQDLSNIN